MRTDPAHGLFDYRYLQYISKERGHDDRQATPARIRRDFAIAQS